MSMFTKSAVSAILFSMLPFAAQPSFAAERVLTWGDTVKNPDGTVMRVYRQSEAADYCRTYGSRLPTISEIAHRAASLGYIQVKETAYPDHEVRPLDRGLAAERDRMDDAGYSAVARIDGIKVFVDFYWHADASPAPAGNEFLGNWYWSSTIYIDGDGNPTVAYTYYGGNDSGGFLTASIRSRWSWGPEITSWKAQEPSGASVEMKGTLQ